MGSEGGPTRACARALLALAALSASALATGCTAPIDRAHGVQTRLGRIDEVVDAQVTTPGPDRGAAIAVTYDGVAGPGGLARLVAETGAVAARERYPSYRLDLRPAASPEDVLVVDDTFAGNPDREAVLDSWFAVTGALLGAVTYTVEQGHAAIVVEAGGAVGHDVTEAGRLRSGFPDTTWTFDGGAAEFAVSGPVSPGDAAMFQRVQRTVSSTSLPAPARAWRLERYDDHLGLDLEVAFRGGPVAPAQLTVGRYGDAVVPLVSTALGAVRPAGLPVWLRLHNPTPEGDDVFGYLVAGQRPVRGRDRFARGWDAWLARRA